MKKLILSLFAVAMVFVACNKEDSMVDSTPELSVTVGEVDLESRFNAFNDFLRGATFTPSEKSNSPSSARGGDNGSDWVELIWFAHGTEHYVFTQPENLGNADYSNIGAGVSNIYRETYSYRASSQEVHIQVGEGAGAVFPIPADLQALYMSAFADQNSALYFANLDGSTWTFREGALPTGTNFNFAPSAPLTFDWRLIAGSTDTYENTNPDITATYRVSPAPFPLSGSLATIVTSDSDNASANYAGTSSSTVIDAIQADIEGRN